MAANGFTPSMRRENSRENGHGRTRPQCERCGVLGHIKAKCYKLVGYPANCDHSYGNWKASSSQHQFTTHHATVTSEQGGHSDASTSLPTLSPEQYFQLLTLLDTSSNPPGNLVGNGPSFNCNSTASFSPTWIIDSGASDHDTYFVFSHNCHPNNSCQSC